MAAHRRRDNEKGAAMMVVLFLILTITATGMFAIHSTSTEIRASGHSRARMQTRYLAEGALVTALARVDDQGPASIQYVLERSEANTTERFLSIDEPPMSADRSNHRLTLEDFVPTAGSTGLVGHPVNRTAGEESLGTGTVFQPEFEIDINDNYRFTGSVPGNRSDGFGQLSYMAATYTARGRTVVPDDTFSERYADYSDQIRRRGYHETSSTARAIGISGPFGR